MEDYATYSGVPRRDQSTGVNGEGGGGSGKAGVAGVQKGFLNGNGGALCGRIQEGSMPHGG